MESYAHFYLNTTDGLMLFVNGRQESAFAANNFYADEEHVKVKLNKKTNKVIMKLFTDLLQSGELHAISLDLKAPSEV